MKADNNNLLPGNARRGMALLLTIVVLVLLSTVVYTLSSKISLGKSRQEYMISYQKARYACDSAVKYALGTIGNLEIQVVERQDHPELYDFSDLYALNHEEYEQLLTDWAIKNIEAEELAAEEDGLEEDIEEDLTEAESEEPPSGPNSDDPNAVEFGSYSDYSSESTEPNEIVIPGPYGQPWPYVSEPVEFEIGDSKITVEIADENAKLPLVWALSKDDKTARATYDGLEAFLEWMQLFDEDMDVLIEQLDRLAEYKEYKLKMPPITKIEKVQVKTSKRTTSSTKKYSKYRRKPGNVRLVNKKITLPGTVHTTDFARLMHSSVIDLETLAKELGDRGKRHESPLKYLGVWGSQKVNINTAPRHVLEATFMFGGDAENIAHEIIQLRREKPFKSMDDLSSRLRGYASALKKIQPYITTKSTFFTIKVKASSGKARVATTIAVVKKGKTITKISTVSY